MAAPYPTGSSGYQPGIPGAPPPQAAGRSSLSSRVELSISCSKLKDTDLLSKSDPMCVLFSKELNSTVWQEVDRTERIDNTLNPVFAHKFVVDYFFEERQQIKFALYDVDSSTKNLDDHDFLGHIEATMGEVVSGGQYKPFERPLTGISHKGSTIIIRAEELATCKEVFEVEFSGSAMKSGSFFGSYSPFFELYKLDDSSRGTLVIRSKHVHSSTTPQWPKMTLKSSQLCNGDRGRSVRVRVMNFKSAGDHSLIGEFTCTANELLKAGTKFDCFNPVKKKNKGVFNVVRTNVITEHTFLDYIMAGVQINCTVAIDFTGSNGRATDPASLHFIHGEENQYQRALRGVLEILQDYDSDKMFPALGFGAKVNGQVSHEFPLTLIPNNPFCAGVQGVLEAYSNCVRRVEFYGPTNFAPVIRHVSTFASQPPRGESYAILLILTDGIITDFEATTNAIVTASSLPMSIIIVGVGNADFSQMDDLDADDAPLRNSSGMKCSRDIVQFVPFNQVLQRYGNNLAMAQHGLAKEVLAEVPNQVQLWYKRNGLTPETIPRSTTAPYPGAPAGGASHPGPHGGAAPYPGAPAGPYPGSAQPSAPPP